MNKNKYRWENLSEYYKNSKFKFMDKMFGNYNNISKEERKELLDKLNINQKQKTFLLSLYDIDWLIVENDKPFLLEEKSTSKFNKGNYIYLSCGTETQAKNLEKASKLGIKSGVMVNLVEWDESSKISLFLNQKDSNILFRKTYLFGELKYNARAMGGKIPCIRVPINNEILRLRERNVEGNN